MTSASTNLYDHTDYRAWMRAWFEARAGRPSVRGFARKARCSPSLVSAVLNDRRALGLERAERWAEELKLDEEERRYFLALVTLEESHAREQRAQALETVMAARHFRAAHRVDEGTYALLARWYIGATLELASCSTWRDDPAWIATTLCPPITQEEATEALETLEGLGALERDAAGTLRPAGEVWTTGHSTSNPILGQALFEQHRRVLQLAARALDEVPGEDRNYSTVTFALPDSLRDEVKRRLRRFQEELVRYVSSAEGPRDRVWHLGMQLFPMSREPG